MGKYMRESKTPTPDLALMEVSHHHQQLHQSLGVRTRAKTLALQRLAKSSATSTTPFHDESSYLQLRSRRLVKPTVLIEPKRKKEVVYLSPNFDLGETLEEGQEEGEGLKEIVEACIGENVVVEFEGTYSHSGRGTRETTPCSLIRDPNTIRTPGSTTRPTNLTDSAAQNSMRRHIPTTHEMDEFFSGAEDEQQKRFIDKYNFDPVNEKPLPGRYEWVKVDP